MDALAISNVSKRYRIQAEKPTLVRDLLLRSFLKKAPTKEFWALKDVSFTVNGGDAVGIIGRNGAGKSTLLKLLSGVIRPTTGSIQTHGRVGALLELGAGFHPELTGRENVYLNASILGVPKREVDQRFASIVHFAEMDEFIDEPVKYYSSGMQVRLGFAVAIGIDPDILIIDEVFAVGDAVFAQKCLEEMTRLKESGKTLILVTHDLKSVEQWCNSAVYLDRGVVRECGPSRRVIDTYLKDVAEEENRQFLEKRNSVSVVVPEPHRWGNREIEITQVRFLRTDGQEARIFHGGDDVAFEVSFVANAPVENPSFGFNVYSAVGVHCFGFSTYLDEYGIEKVEGEGRVSALLKNLPLVAGEYFLEVAVAQVCLGGNYLTLDYISWRAKRFSFKMRSERGAELGVINPQRSWKFEGLAPVKRVGSLV